MYMGNSTLSSYDLLHRILRKGRAWSRPSTLIMNRRKGEGEGFPGGRLRIIALLKTSMVLIIVLTTSPELVVACLAKNRVKCIIEIPIAYKSIDSSPLRICFFGIKPITNPAREAKA